MRDPMLGEFEVHEAVALEDRSLFALVGVITRGTARAGMKARLEEGGATSDEATADEGASEEGASDEATFDVRVHGVEFVDRPEEEGGGSEPALTFSYGSDEKLARWRAVDWPGRRLRLYWEG